MRKQKIKKELLLNTTVMVDMLFNVFIFFIIVTQVRSDRIDVKLPTVEKKNEGAKLSQKPQQYTISIDDSNRIYLNGNPVASVDELGRELESLKMKNEEGEKPLVTLKTDKSSKSGTLVEIINLLSEAGLVNVQFDVQTKKEDDK